MTITFNLTSSTSFLYLSLGCLCIVNDVTCASSPSAEAFVAFPKCSAGATSLSLSERRPETASAPRSHPSGRRWKTRRQRQAFLPAPARNVSPREERALREQLGYVPPNVVAVSARGGDCADAPRAGRDATGAGRPLAIRAYPLLVQRPDDAAEEADPTRRRVTPFPTLYWLTCPRVARAVADLERLGHVRAFQRVLEDDAALAARWRCCHRAYAAERWAALSGHDRAWLTRDGASSMADMVRWSGVAGADRRGPREGDASFVPSVKCLHSHYAHYRSQLAQRASRAEGEGEEHVINLVGQWTHELLLELWPEIV